MGGREEGGAGAGIVFSQPGASEGSLLTGSSRLYCKSESLGCFLFSYFHSIFFSLSLFISVFFLWLISGSLLCCVSCCFVLLLLLLMSSTVRWSKEKNRCKSE